MTEQKKIKEQIRQWRLKKCKRSYNKYQAAFMDKAKDIIQAKEFNGKIYLAYNDEPLLPVDELQEDIATALCKTRKHWVEYKTRKFCKRTFNV